MAGLGELQMVKNGWLEKYSVGRGIIPFKNWQRRWFCVDHAGLNYAKSPNEAPSRRTFIPFVAGSAASGDVVMAPVFLYPNVTKDIHPEATGDAFYFALRFQERGTPRLLLVRSNDRHDRDTWVRFLAQFVHAAALSGVPMAHPTVHRKGIDPDELDPRERLQLKQTIMDWDEGLQLRAVGAEEPLQPDHFDDCAVWASDDESHNPSRRGSKSAGQTPSAQSPRRAAAPPADDFDCL
uniref:PH domain-containing protein n=1 Tax=Neobodo designis TaxID=312471 RepID=A0A7S1QAK3_NEODS|mmetsp:Transcript_36799/g.113543  ORF Transcript_36799/g.113543 Transcript_36799/m.113543 type:complete len:237 (+) Transcript_36799:35-745(+)